MKNTEQDENQRLKLLWIFLIKNVYLPIVLCLIMEKKMSKNKAKKDALEINCNQTNLRYVFPVFWHISTQRFSNTFSLEVQLFPGSSVKGVKTRDWIDSGNLPSLMHRNHRACLTILMWNREGQSQYISKSCTRVRCRYTHAFWMTCFNL